MRRLSFIITTLLVFAFNSTAQTTVTLKVAFQHADYGLFKRARVSVNNQQLSTNDSGILKIVLPKSANSVKISLPQSNHMLLLYPPDGHLPVPKDGKEVPLVIVGKPEAHFQLSKYLQLVLLKENLKGEALSDVKWQLDSLRFELFRNNVAEATIVTAELAALEKRKYISQVIADITALRTSISDFKANYKFLAVHAFEEGAALDTLIGSVSHYNSCYSKFEKQHAHYELMQRKYWSNAGVINDLRSYSDFLVNKVHAPCIYPMQEAILQIRQYYSGKKKNKNTRKLIEANTALFIAAIDNILPALDKETNQLLTDLIDN
jgi:hypothetical protein